MLEPDAWRPSQLADDASAQTSPLAAAPQQATSSGGYRWLKWLWALICIALIGSVIAFLIWVFLPKPDLYAGHDYSRLWLDRNDGLLRLELAADQRYRLQLTNGQIAASVKDATLLYEDRFFYQHPGINPAAIFKAATESLLGNGRQRGASTITMQLARLRWRLSTRDIPGKLLQMGRALQIERHYSKADILTAYLNLAPYGGNIEGVGAASWLYFDKPASELTTAESLALAVIPQNPVARDPDRARDNPALKSATQRLTHRWLNQHPQDTGLLDLSLHFRQRKKAPLLAPHQVTALAAADAQHRSGQISTTIDPDLQHLLETHIRSHIQRKAAIGIDNAAAMLVNTRTMQVMALMGSADFHNDSIAGQVDGTRALRSPGSALKPFVYALALDQGLIHPMTLMKDAPRRFGAYTPENYDRRFAGPVFARDALILSRNVPAVTLMAQLEPPGLYGLLENIGIDRLQPAEHYGLALALGGAEVSMHELIELYAMLANLGRYQPLQHTLNEGAAGDKKLLSREAAFLILEMLRRNPPPQGPSAAGASGRNFAIYWKTGTSYAFRDAWAVGLFGQYALAVWVGRFDGQGNPAYVGRSAAGPLFFELADAIAATGDNITPERIWPTNLNVVNVEVCATTGDLASRHCPQTTESGFIPGISPIRVSSIYRAIPIFKSSGLRACRHQPPATHMQVYEFWPSDLLALFQQAGLPRRLPPDFAEDCQGFMAQGRPPEIRSPSASLQYVLRPDNQRIPFSAISDTDSRQLYWFVDSRYVGKTRPGKAFMWQAQPGEYEVRVVDDQGRAASVKLRVDRT